MKPQECLIRRGAWPHCSVIGHVLLISMRHLPGSKEKQWGRSGCSGIWEDNWEGGGRGSLVYDVKPRNFFKFYFFKKKSNHNYAGRIYLRVLFLDPLESDTMTQCLWLIYSEIKPNIYHHYSLIQRARQKVYWCNWRRGSFEWRFLKQTILSGITMVKLSVNLSTRKISLFTPFSLLGQIFPIHQVFAVGVPHS